MLKLYKAFGLCRILQTAGYEAYIVGGAVRDALLNRPIHDVDIATNARPEQIAKVFHAMEGFIVVPTGEKFGTMTVIADDDKIEVTTYRSEGKYTDKRHPDEIKFEDTLEKDLSRRDFTINAMALDGLKVIDPFHGKPDLDNHILRTVGSPYERFEEDPLRMLRMCRFACKLSFIINRYTFDAAKTLSRFILDIPVERIKDELFRILAIENPTWAFEYMVQSGLMQVILPEVTRTMHVIQPKPHEYKVMYHMFETVRNIPNSKLLLRFAGLIHDIGKLEKAQSRPYFVGHHLTGTDMTLKICERLKFSNDEVKYVEFIVKHHMDVHFNKNMTPRGARRYLSRIENPDWINDLIVHVRADIISSGGPLKEPFEEVRDFEVKILKVKIEKEPFKISDLAINGYDIMDLGILAGPLIGKIQNTLLDEVIEDPTLNVRQHLLNRAREIILVEENKK